MRIEKLRRKWIVKGEGKGWLYNKIFPTKWKTEKAVEVFKRGGRVSDYWAEIRKTKRLKREPWRVMEKLERAIEEIEHLNPSCEEIIKYGEKAEYGEVTITTDEECFEPHIHNTWGVKLGGRVHIDIGCGGYHLMLDKDSAKKFIKFIKNERKTATA